MKKIIILFLLYLPNIALTQEKIIFSNKGVVIFEASVPLFEEVKAKNETPQYILNTKTGEITSSVLMKDFHFKLSLMEEHFNEKYLESDHYPKATFKGVIEGFNWNIIGTTPKEFKMKGKLRIHGKSKKIDTIVTLRKTETGIELISNFNVTSTDFNIKIPQILTMKVAEIVNIKTLFLFNKPVFLNNP